MNNRMIYVYIFNTMADWEPAYVLAELNSKRYFRKDAPNLTVRTCALTRDAIQTMGGLTVVPDLTVDEIEPQNGALLLLPGGDKWLDPSRTPSSEMLSFILHSSQINLWFRRSNAQEGP